MAKNWSGKVTTTSVYEGPPGTLGRDRTPHEMAYTLLRVNPDKSKGSILRYMQFVINRSGRNMTDEHRRKIKEAMAIIRGDST